jgi:lipopolysaccharide assembly outer membrane protein LptD (OstA)
VAALLALGLVAQPSVAEGDQAERKRTERRLSAKPGEAPEMSAGRIEQTAPGEFLLTGDVDLRYGTARLLADTARYSEATRTAVAEGNVVIQFKQNEISGDSVEVNLDSGYASIENARAYMEPDVIVDAERLERIAEDTYRITHGKITTCTQPTPYWSFSVSKAVVRLGGYARMTNASFKLGHVPSFWSPYLVWPVKEDRAAGLLLPQFGFSGSRGAFLGNALYVPLGRSMDATFQLDLFNGTISDGVEQLSQSGQGLEFRYVPSQSGSGILTGYHLIERFRTAPGADVETRSRYRVNLAHTQRLPQGFKLLTDLNTVSDLDYFQDFEREITATTNPTVLSLIDLSRLSGPLALNVRLSRQLQYLGADPYTLDTEDLTLWRLPELELRGRGIRLGRSRFYLNFISSAGGLGRRARTVDDDGRMSTDQVTYGRLDFFPSISGNFTPVPWLDISPSVSLRETLYTASDQAPGSELDPNGPALRREAFRLGVRVVGPRLFRIFGGDDPGASQYKHTFEPSVSYDYAPEVTGAGQVIPFDEIDVTPAVSNLLGYSLTSRLFAKRPPRRRGEPEPPPALAGPFASLVLGEKSPRRHEEFLPAAEGEGAPEAAAGAEEPSEEAGLEEPEEPGPDTVDAEDADETLRPALDRAASDTFVAPEISTARRGRRDREERRPDEGEPRRQSVGAVEIATFDLTQLFTFDNAVPLSRSAALSNTSQFSPVRATLRYNPTRGTSLDIRAAYDILHHDLSSISLSGNARVRNRGYARLSWFLNRDLEGTPTSLDPSCATSPGAASGRAGVDEGRCFRDNSQIRLLGGIALLKQKLTLDVEGSYDIEDSFLLDQRLRMGYNTQCCGVLVEFSKRSFLSATVGETSETQYRFVLNLRGVGTFLDLNGRAQ